MPAEPGDSARLWDMLDSGRAVLEYVRHVSFEDYCKQWMLRAAVEREIEIIGEAARKVSDTFRNAHPEIPRKSIMAQRHVVAHDYGEINHERIWNVITVHLPKLLAQLERWTPSSSPRRITPPPLE